MNAATHRAPSALPAVKRWAGVVHRAGLLVWALGLGGLSLVMGIAEAQDGWMNLATHLLVALVIVALALTSWLWPRWGGMALGAAGVWAAWFFTGSFAWIFLASPAVVLGGLGILIDGSRPEAELPAGK